MTARNPSESLSRTYVECPIVGRRDVARDTVILTLGVDFDVDVTAGQFAMVHTGDDDEYVLPRPYSILEAAGGRMDLLVKIAGRGSRELAACPEGTTARVFAPLGRGFDLGAFRGRPSILVAGGVGVVPLYRLARELKRSGESVRPLFGARMPVDLPMELLGEQPAGPWDLWVEADPEEGHRQGLVTMGLEKALEEAPDAVVATCGPTPMMHAVARICRARSSPLFVCLEEQMGCGAGVCRACVIEDASEARMHTVCKDGPVFSLDTIRFLPEDQEPTTTEGACVR